MLVRLSALSYEKVSTIPVPLGRIWVVRLPSVSYPNDVVFPFQSDTLRRRPTLSYVCVTVWLPGYVMLITRPGTTSYVLPDMYPYVTVFPAPFVALVRRPSESY